MAVKAREITDYDLSHWIWGTRFFSADDGKHFVVSADLEEYPTDGRFTYIRRDTVVLYCTPEAGVTDMDVDFTFAPGTTPEEAVAQMGYTLE